jgi:hypothetical protein
MSDRESARLARSYRTSYRTKRLGLHLQAAPNASPTGAVDWFRALREIEHRLAEACARTQCSVNEHRPDPLRTWLTDQDQWRTFVEADVHDREQQVIGEGLIGGA